MFCEYMNNNSEPYRNIILRVDVEIFWRRFDVQFPEKTKVILPEKCNREALCQHILTSIDFCLSKYNIAGRIFLWERNHLFDWTKNTLIHGRETPFFFAIFKTLLYNS